ncbi:hypothetical protein Tsubulata_046585 [Turnera subulata]|uniref:EF hand associated type-2 domain-containing protein n=1 Tax=Turnera subulata TaxID=218843 RepID=A0A9Q0J4F4_9ROSI|nr:hypothetical protein Tsubulata_046585 [Turnera subulata]
MAKTSGRGSEEVRIVIAGESGTGKSSLICTGTTGLILWNPQPCVDPITFREDFFADDGPLTIIDTSSKLEDAGSDVAEQLKRADAVVLTYACDRQETLDRLGTHWLPQLRNLQVKMPVMVVGCKRDLMDANQQESFWQMLSQIKQQFPEIKQFRESSVFDDPNSSRCSIIPNGPDQFTNDMNWLALRLPSGVNERGLTLEGFLATHAIFLGRGEGDTTWLALRKFGLYDAIQNDAQNSCFHQHERTRTLPIGSTAPTFQLQVSASVKSLKRIDEVYLIVNLYSFGILTADTEPFIQEQALSFVRNPVDGCAESIGFISVEDGIILDAVGRQLKCASKAEIGIQNNYQGNISSPSASYYDLGEDAGMSNCFQFSPVNAMLEVSYFMGTADQVVMDSGLRGWKVALTPQHLWLDHQQNRRQ